MLGLAEGWGEGEGPPKGRRSTWCTSSGRFLVCSYSMGNSSGRASRTAAGLLCATQLSASSAPRRTWRSVNGLGSRVGVGVGVRARARPRARARARARLRLRLRLGRRVRIRARARVAP